MADFLLIYCRNHDLMEGQPSPQQLQDSISEWRRWFKTIDAQNRKIKPFCFCACDGVVVQLRKISIGIYVEVKESLGGFTFLQAANYEEAVAIARNCPILQLGGNIEIRMIYKDDGSL
jgi:hypothetical protein